MRIDSTVGTAAAAASVASVHEPGPPRTSQMILPVRVPGSGDDFQLRGADVASPSVGAENVVATRPVDQGAAGQVTSRWIGGMTHDSASVVVKVPPGAKVQLVALEASETAGALGPAVEADADGMARLVATGLEADHHYRYGITVDGVRAPEVEGAFQTFPKPGEPASYSFAFGSCAGSGSNHPVFRTILERDPRFFLQLGDFHYENIQQNEPARFRQAFDRALSQPNQAALYGNIPTTYTWDDHDFGGNDSSMKSKAREAARRTYRQYVPHYALPAGPGNAPIYQSFVVGRVRFIVTDLRSERTSRFGADDGTKTMMGEEQREWFKRELASPEPLKVWACSPPWNAHGAFFSDDWGGYDRERQELIRHMHSEGKGHLYIVAGDAHMLAADDGTNSPGGFPVVHGSPLDRSPSEKGGPYSHGTHGAVGQFGWVDVEDDGQTITLHYTGRNARDEVKIDMTKSFEAPSES